MIAVRSLGYEPLCFTEDPGSSITVFQRRLCAALKWRSPQITISRMLVWLTRITFATSRHKAVEQTAKLLRRPTDELVVKLELLPPIWSECLRSEEPDLPGRSFLLMMLTACSDRLLHPGQFTLPHAFQGRLAALLPLPLIQFEGTYYFDGPSTGMSVGGPFDLFPGALARDCIYLLALMPLIVRKARCGFIEDGILCLYQKAGFGCPQTQLGVNEVDLRETYGIADWCHWTFNMVRFELDQETLTRWRARIRPKKETSSV
jgi:hypothetical protein